jgi:hypothetical protein
MNVVKNIKEIFLGHVSDDDVVEYQDEITDLTVKAHLFLEAKNLPVTAENILLYKNEIAEQPMDEVEEKTTASLGKLASPTNTNEDIAKLQKEVKILKAFGWIFLALTVYFIIGKTSSTN